MTKDRIDQGTELDVQFGLSTEVTGNGPPFRRSAIPEYYCYRLCLNKK